MGDVLSSASSKANGLTNRRRAIGILRYKLVRAVGLLPQGVWSTDYLDTREGVVSQIGERART